MISLFVVVILGVFALVIIRKFRRQVQATKDKTTPQMEPEEKRKRRGNSEKGDNVKKVGKRPSERNQNQSKMSLRRRVNRLEGWIKRSTIRRLRYLAAKQEYLPPSQPCLPFILCLSASLVMITSKNILGKCCSSATCICMWFYYNLLLNVSF